LTHIALLLFKVKLKQYLGQLRRSPTNILSLLLVYLTWLSIIGLVSVMLRFTGILSGSGPRGFLGILSEVTVTAVLALGAFLGVKGGITAFPYEIDYVLTSGVRPRVFLLSDLLFQIFLLSFFMLPPTSLMISILTFPLHLDYLSRAIPLYMSAIFMAVLLSHALGVSRVPLGERGAKLVGVIVMFIILAPLIFLALRIKAPEPLALHPALLLTSAMEKPTQDLAWMAVYITALAAAYVYVSRLNFYSTVSPILFSVLMEPPSRVSRYVKFPERVERVFNLGAAGGFYSLMYKLHLVRIVREGSLWTGVMVLLFLTLANTAVPRLIGIAQFPEVAELTMIALYIPLLPALLSINWSISERPNIWMVKLSREGERPYVSGLFLAYLTVTLPFSLLLYGLVSIGSSDAPFLLVDMALLTAMSCFGSILSIIVALAMRIAPSPLSLGSLLYIVIPLTGSILISLPVLVIRLFEPLASSPPPAIILNLAAYIGVSTFALYRVLTHAGHRYLRTD